MQPTPHAHPIQFDIDHPDGPRDRTSAIFRLILAIPILILLATFGATGFQAGNDGASFAGVASGVLFIPPLLLIVFRQKYPRWTFDFNLAYLRLHNRAFAYLLLLRDEYPSSDEEQAVHLHVAYPDVRNELNRWLPLVKWFLAIPHYIVLILLDVGVVLAAIATWFAIAVTGRHPRRLFDFTVGVMRWHNRVIAYAFVLATDDYPPFRLTA
ncbi:MAG: conserved hypothetical rane protein [Acidimicrobiales bacterium]|nr:conserved hypothetical rane protein [Acidimicrobiales bacterium]